MQDLAEKAAPSRDVPRSVAIVELPLLTGASVFTTRPRAADAKKYLEAFAPIANRLPREPHVMRLVDLDCGPGWFAAFAGARFPYVWVDCFHAAPPIATDDEGEARAQREIYEDHVLEQLNAPVGTRGHADLPETVPTCDMIHVGPRALFGDAMKFDGPALERLQIAIIEWNDTERLESFSGFMRAIGLEAEAVGMFEPARGWVMYVRRGASRIPINVDMTRRSE